MNKIALREATIEDIDKIFEIFSPTDEMHRENHPEIFRQSHYPEQTKEYYRNSIISPYSTIIVAEADEVIIGAAVCSLETAAEIPILVPRKFACIENITVVEKYQKQGFGKYLIESAQQWATAKGAARIELTVWEFNQGAASFYHNLGFRTLHRRMVKDL
jgi:ribosomal protein S18 acetylase RimI-like enzyme